MDDFQERVAVAQELRDVCREYGIRLRVNFDGTITLFHGTSMESADKIRQVGFFAGTYFSHAKSKTGYCDEGPAWYAREKCNNGCVLEVHVDARCVEFVSGTGEFYCPKAIRYDEKSNLWRDAEVLDKAQSVDGLIEDAEGRCNDFPYGLQKLKDREVLL